MPVNFSFRRFCFPIRILRLRSLFAKTQYWEPERLRAWQDERLAEVVRVACRRIPYWRDLFREHHLTPDDIRTVADLQKLPTLSRDVLQQDLKRLVAPHRWTQVVTSTGTSGKPVALHMDAQANALEFVFYWRHFGWAGYRLHDRLAQISDYHFARRRRPLPRPYDLRPAINHLLLDLRALSPERIHELVEGIRTYKPKFLRGRPRDLYYMALLLKDRGLDDLTFRAVFTVAENVLPQFRQTIEETFGCKVFDAYGHMERAVAISQCERGGYHVNADYGILELDDLQPRGLNGEVMSPALGTSLHNFAMPMLRYEVGDYIEPYPGTAPPCPCGRTLPLIKAIHGRMDDVIVMPTGRVINGLSGVFRATGVCEFGQIIQDARDHLTLLIVPGDQWGAAQDEAVKALLLDMLGPTMRVDIRHGQPSDLVLSPGGKFRPIVSGHTLADETPLQ